MGASMRLTTLRTFFTCVLMLQAGGAAASSLSIIIGDNDGYGWVIWEISVNRRWS
jgi:hypothetical protein